MCNFIVQNIVSICIRWCEHCECRKCDSCTESVGYKFQEHALIFGGNVLTASYLAFYCKHMV